jgi:hypothetical protein
VPVACGQLRVAFEKTRAGRESMYRTEFENLRKKSRDD